MGWYKITPKTKDEIPFGQNAWTDEDLRKNLVEQSLHFPDHEAGDESSLYAAHDKQMRDMCHTEQCMIQFSVGTGMWRASTRISEES